MNYEELPEDTVRRYAIMLAEKDEQIEQLGDSLTDRTIQLIITSLVCMALMIVLVYGAAS